MALDKELELVLRRALEDISNGDEKAMETFYDITVSYVYGLALRITRSPEDAEEAVSDTFMQVWSKASSYQSDKCPAFGWLMMMCRSRSLDQLRRRKHANNSVNIDDVQLPTETEEMDPQYLLHSLDRHSGIHAAIKNLDQESQQLLGLAFFRGMTHSSIAITTGMPIGTVKTRLRKILLTLRNTLQDTNSEQGDEP